MSKINAYKQNHAFGGWTRIDLLLSIYDQAISSIGFAKSAFESEDQAKFAEQFLMSQKAILAIHSGLKPDEYEIAFSVARLLHFVLASLEKNKFDDAIKVLTELRSGFAEIQGEANQLELTGAIDKLEYSDEYAAQV